MRRVKIKMYLRMLWQDWQCKIHGHLWEAHHAYTGPGCIAQCSCAIGACARRLNVGHTLSSLAE